MAKSTFKRARITGITAVVPEKCIDIDDEVEFFNNDRSLLERNKKILGLGTRHVVDEEVAVSDLLAAAAGDDWRPERVHEGGFVRLYARHVWPDGTEDCHASRCGVQER